MIMTFSGKCVSKGQPWSAVSPCGSPDWQCEVFAIPYRRVFSESSSSLSWKTGISTAYSGQGIWQPNYLAGVLQHWLVEQ